MNRRRAVVMIDLMVPDEGKVARSMATEITKQFHAFCTETFGKGAEPRVKVMITRFETRR